LPINNNFDLEALYLQ